MSTRNILSSSSSSTSSSIRRQAPEQRHSKSHDELVNEVVATSLGTDEQSAVLIKYVLMAVGAITVIKVLSQSLMYLALAVSPLLYGYLKATCPATSTFDAKEELKPILEGKHLPETHPNKPKSKLEQMLQSAKASVVAEYSALVGDTQVEFTDWIGIAILAKVTCQQQSYYWIGARNEWKFVYSCAVNPTSAKGSGNNNNNNTYAIRRSSGDDSLNSGSVKNRRSSLSASAAAAAAAVLSASTSSHSGYSSKN